MAQIRLARHALSRRPGALYAQRLTGKNLDQLRQTNDPPRARHRCRQHRLRYPQAARRRFGMKLKVISGYPAALIRTWRWNETRCNAAPYHRRFFFAREPFITWQRKALCAWLHTEKQRHARCPRCPACRANDQYKVAEPRPSGAYLLGLWGSVRCHSATPGVPPSGSNCCATLCQSILRSRISRGPCKQKRWEAAPYLGKSGEPCQEVVNQPEEVATALKGF